MFAKMMGLACCSSNGCVRSFRPVLLLCVAYCIIKNTLLFCVGTNGTVGADRKKTRNAYLCFARGGMLLSRSAMWNSRIDYVEYVDVKTKEYTYVPSRLRKGAFERHGARPTLVDMRYHTPWTVFESLSTPRRRRRINQTRRFRKNSRRGGSHTAIFGTATLLYSCGAIEL